MKLEIELDLNKIDYDAINQQIQQKITDLDLTQEYKIDSRIKQEIDTQAVYEEVLKRVGFGKQITLEKARKLAEKVRQKSTEMGLKAVIAIANAQGRPILVEVMDDAFLVSFDVAIKKAYSSAAVKMSTAQLAKEVKEGGSLIGLETEQSLIFLAGGEPLKVGWEVVGAIGVSGGTGEQDGILARYAAEQFKTI
jgi:uncharacterized protein GlcG (DUF336 family)